MEDDESIVDPKDCDGTCLTPVFNPDSDVVRHCTVASRPESTINSDSKNGVDKTDIKLVCELNNNTTQEIISKTLPDTYQVIRERRLSPQIKGIKSEILEINPENPVALGYSIRNVSYMQTVDPNPSTGGQGSVQTNFVATSSDLNPRENLAEQYRPPVKDGRCICRRCDQVYFVDPTDHGLRKRSLEIHKRDQVPLKGVNEIHNSPKTICTNENCLTRDDQKLTHLLRRKSKSLN